MLILCFLQPLTGGQSQVIFLCAEQRHFNLTVQQKGGVLLGRPLCMLIITKTKQNKKIKVKVKERDPAWSQGSYLQQFLLSTLISFQRVLKINRCSSIWFNPCRGRWQAPNQLPICSWQEGWARTRVLCSKTPNSLKGFSKAFLKARGGRGVLGYVISSCTILWLVDGDHSLGIRSKLLLMIIKY